MKSQGAPRRPLLSVAMADVVYGGVRALNDLTIDINHRATALIGPNGAGKSTLVNVITGFQAPRSGRWHLGDRELTGWSPQRIARAGLVRTFQSPRLLPGLSVRENLMLADAHRCHRGLATAVFARRRVLQEEARSRARVDEALERFDLAPAADLMGDQISGGQQRLVELARVTLKQPQLLVLDEPTAGVAPRMRSRVTEHLRWLRDERGVALLVVEHDMKVVEELADDVLVLSNGALMARGTMAEMRVHRGVVDAYLGAEVPAHPQPPGSA